jgi:hypothetical protein
MNSVCVFLGSRIGSHPVSQADSKRIYQGIAEINEAPVVFRWRYKMDEIVTE